MELAAVLAGPSAGTFLAELGAEVIKIENPATRGDVTRSWKLLSEDPHHPISAYYASVNGLSKEVLMADLKADADRQKVDVLIEQADVVISSFRPGSGQRLGLDGHTLLKKHPKLIVGEISGYGPQSGRAAYDMVIQAETGFLHMNGYPGTAPAKLPVALMDILAAHQLKEGLLVALLQKEKQGKGALVQVSLFDAAISALANQASNYLMAGHIPGPLGSLHPNIAPYGEQFECADGRSLVLAVGSDRQFQALGRLLKLNENQLRDFADNGSRLADRERLQSLLQEAFARDERSFWLESMVELDIPAGAIRNLEEVFGTKEGSSLIQTELCKELTIKRIPQAIFNIQSDFES